MGWWDYWDYYQVKYDPPISARDDTLFSFPEDEDKMVKVIWVDPTFEAQTFDPDMAHPEDAMTKVETLGFLVHEDSQVLVVAMNRSDRFQDDEDYYDDYITIPRSLVESVKALKEA